MQIFYNKNIGIFSFNVLHDNRNYFLKKHAKTVKSFDP